MLLTVEGQETYCATGGRPFDRARPVSVFLHGAGMDHSCWPLQARWFAWHGWSVLAPDLPGHGRSAGAPLKAIDAMAEWTLALMQAAGVSTVALIGHSMGGAIALETAALLGDKATHLALIGSAGAIPVGEALLAAADKDPASAYQMMTEWGHGPAAKIGGNVMPGLWMTGAAKALLGNNRPGVLHADLAACNAWTTGVEAAARVTCPVLIVTASHDMMTPARKGRELVKSLRAAEAVTLERSGHMIMQEAPDAWLDALIRFMGEGKAKAA